MSKTWYVQPLSTTLLETLIRKQGSCTDVDLYDSLREQYPDLSFSEVNRTLMDLELNGLIHVYTLTKNQRGVTLIT
ncbi:MAG: hypothetical protein JSV76_03385 [Candidatus Bathyarchaeota archaeon]|nr:MAG: hypothetical protein JSV76_03385 [Candidatus Bathyarchaeota archaeon]